MASGKQSMDPSPDVKEYLEERHVTELFECLTAALVHERPKDPVDFLLHCLDRVQEVGYQNVFWDTFIPQLNAVDRSSGLSSSLSSSRARSTVTFAGTEQVPKKMAAPRQVITPAASISKEVNDSVEKKADKEIPIENDTEDASPLINETQISDPKMLAIFRGTLNDIPKIPTNIVRIFLSSTFSDYRAERNMLPREAYPQLQNFCREHGLDFQVIDMRWGVTDEMMNDHQVADLCIQEIKHCQQVSCGPSFVTLLGNRYGYRPFPSVIENGEFHIILEQLPGIGLAGKAELLKTWFKEDTNAIPSSFVLQPIASILKHFNDETDAKLNKKDRDSWNNISDELHSVLSKASKAAFKKGLITKESLAKYQISVTEMEIEAGLLKARSPPDQGICYTRTLNGLTKYLNKINTSRFVDAITLLSDEKSVLTLDEEATENLKTLREAKIKKVIDIPEDRTYDIDWKGVNLEDSDDETHLQYLQLFCRQFVQDMKRMIAEYLDHQVRNQMDERYRQLYHEIVHHAKFANVKLELFCGRVDVLTQLKNMMMDAEDEHFPIMIHANSGHGKTSLLAKCASLVPHWLPGDTSVILRFLGTSPKCSNIRDTLVSVLAQMSALLNYTLPSAERLEKMGEVRKFFSIIVDRIGRNHADKQFVIILDSVDQLSELYGAYRFSWLPRQLPRNVHIILSAISNFQGIVENYKNRIIGETGIIALRSLPLSTAEDIMNTFLGLHKSSLTKEQQALILNAYNINAQPLYLKLVLDRALQWHSYTVVNIDDMPSGVQNAIEMLFKDMEFKYGQVFVSRALSYLTCGHGGLTEIEIDDILSCDDEVLNEVYKYHDPPLEGTVRIPSLLWARLGNELKEYLAEKQEDNKNVLTWYHRQFRETAESYYLSNTLKTEQLHSNLANLFLQTDGIRRTITLTQRKGKTIHGADRRVTPQILSLTNLRKLNALPYHLYRGKQFPLLKNECLLDFDFVFTKLRAVGITELFREFNDIVGEDFSNDESVKLMRDFLELTYDALLLDANLFPFFVNSSFTAYRGKCEYTGIESMLNSAEQWLKNTDVPIMLPTNPLNFTLLDSPVTFSQQLGFDGEISKNEEVAILYWKDANSGSSKINVFDMIARENIARINLTKDSPAIIIGDDKSFAVFNENKLCFHELYTGDKIRNVILLDREYETCNARCMAVSNDNKSLVVVLKLGKPTGLKEKEHWRITGTLCHLDLTTPNSECPKLISTPYVSKRHIEKIFFVAKNSKLATVKRDGILFFSLPDLKQVHQNVISTGYLIGKMASYLHAQEVIIGPVIQPKGCCCLVYNCIDMKIKSSPLLHCEATGDDGASLTSFGTIADSDLSMILIGTNNIGEKRNTRLWLWDIESNEVKKIVISEGIWRVASAMTVLPDWEHVVIGYQTGDITLVSLTKQQELRDVHAHGNIVNVVTLYNNNKNLLSMASDHSLKLWDMHNLLTGKDEKEVEQGEDRADLPLDTREQVVDLATSDKHAITVSHLTREGPRYWNLHNGFMDDILTKTHGSSYENILKDIHQLNGPRYHASVELIDEFLIYQRKRRNGFLIYVTKAYGDTTPLGYQFFEESFFNLAVRQYGERAVIFVVSDGCLEKREIPTLNLIQSAEIPRITDEITNLESKNTKRKLVYYKIAVTIDDKYFVICNPQPNAVSGKYVDVIDTAAMKYVVREPLPRTTGWHLLEDSFCYLCIEDNPKKFSVLKPSILWEMDIKKYTYICPLFAGQYYRGLLSENREIGLEIYKDFNIRVWNVSPLHKLVKLCGHNSDINSTAISLDNRYICSGSFDNTIRVWSVKSGAMLCIFHLYGNVRSVLFTPNNQYVVAKYHSAPQRTRAALLKLKNIE